MKKKGMTYLLVLGVVAVWALIIRKVINSTQEEQISPKNLNVSNNEKEELKWYMVSYQIDSISSQEIRNDPFAKKAEEPIIKPEALLVIVPKTPVYQAPPVVWPQIVFQGFSLKRAQKAGKYAILTINNQPFMLAEGETASGVKLQKNWGDSLALTFQEKNKKFYLQTK